MNYWEEIKHIFKPNKQKVPICKLKGHDSFTSAYGVNIVTRCIRCGKILYEGESRFTDTYALDQDKRTPKENN